MITNTPSKPIPIYLRLFTKLIALNTMTFPLSYKKKPSTSAPAITEAI